MSILALRIRAAFCGLGPLAMIVANLTCHQQQNDKPSLVETYPQQVIVHLSGSDVEVSFDGGKFAPWPVVEANLAASTVENRSGVVVRVRVANTTARDLMESIGALRLAFPRPQVLVEYGRMDSTGIISEIFVTDALNGSFEMGCALISVAYDGTRLEIRTNDPSAVMRRSELRLALDAPFASSQVPGMAITDIGDVSRFTDFDMDQSFTCEGLPSSRQCESTLAQSSDNIFRIGVPCRKAFLHVPARLEWSELAMLFEAIGELGADEVFLGALWPPNLGTEDLLR